jgi:hypothetical protein
MKEFVRHGSNKVEDKRSDSRDTAHVVFSMPPGSPVEALRGAVRATTAKSFPDHEWVFGIHEDTKHPHAHMVLKMRSREKGKKLRLNKPQLYLLRERFAEAARERGFQRIWKKSVWLHKAVHC